MKTILTLLTAICLLFSVSLFSQNTNNLQLPTSVNSDGSPPAASAILDVQATDKGMLVPRMTTAQRTAIASPATGLLVFDTTTGGFWFYNGTVWADLSAPRTLQDTDGNTKVQVEESPDEDIIRFDLGGTENMVLRKNAGGHARLEFAGSNTFVGEGTGQANTTGISNTASGWSALLSNTTGSDNTASGWAALLLNTTGGGNTASGWSALYSNTTGFDNTASGRSALFNNTTGYQNTASGRSALFNNTTGYYNTASGWSALYSNTTGFDNTASGWSALYSNTTGNYNTASGRSALFNNTTGYYNTASGWSALYSNTTGDGNTGLGTNTNVSTGNLNFATAIGNTATVNTSNKVRIGNASVTVIEGQVPWTFPSDARFKFNIHDENVPGLAFINQLRPVTYQFDTRKFDEHLMQKMPDSIQHRRMAGQDYSKSSATVQTGFLAKEVEEVCKDLNFTFSGLHVPESEVDNYGLAYGSFVPLLVKAVQEQQVEIEKLEIRNLEIEQLKTENAALKSQLDKITAALQGAGIAVEK